MREVVVAVEWNGSEWDGSLGLSLGKSAYINFMPSWSTCTILTRHLYKYVLFKSSCGMLINFFC